MGRGLSEQQRQVLTTALENRLIESRDYDSSGADLYEYEVLATIPVFSENIIWSLRDRDGSRTPGSNHFKQSAIDEKVCNRARASISRTFRRLEQRGLVERMEGRYSRWSGINLTSDGIVEACRLSLLSDLSSRVAEGKKIFNPSPVLKLLLSQSSNIPSNLLGDNRV